jgi:hypothetical protein
MLCNHNAASTARERKEKTMSTTSKTAAEEFVNLSTGEVITLDRAGNGIRAYWVQTHEPIDYEEFLCGDGDDGPPQVFLTREAAEDAAKEYNEEFNDDRPAAVEEFEVKGAFVEGLPSITPEMRKAYAKVGHQLELFLVAVRDLRAEGKKICASPKGWFVAVDDATAEKHREFTEKVLAGEVPCP